MPGLCAKAACSYEKSKDFWRQKEKIDDTVVKTDKGKVWHPSYDVRLNEPHAAISGIIDQAKSMKISAVAMVSCLKRSYTEAVANVWIIFCTYFASFTDQILSNDGMESTEEKRKEEEEGIKREVRHLFLVVRNRILFEFVVYDAKAGRVFAALGTNEGVGFFWGIAADGVHVPQRTRLDKLRASKWQNGSSAEDS
ncbi:unnamed protein product [Dovyalis caffra]|uniref:DUF3700 domain-containing protein n=1 Tax=Dovyalis caffra TaxID=77055 RepID=A0AAV1S8C0_9ROSI|nr:unnamed protein product [Dovyalis caffra]